ncbi:MAG: biotin--[acetyl-CoA-carboxylase] ligase [Halanaeroarchaeum sp.]
MQALQAPGSAARRLFERLLEGPVPRGDAEPDEVEALRGAGVDIESTDGTLRLQGYPAYGWAAIVGGLTTDVRVEYHDSLPSTNDRGRELALEGHTDVAVVADVQLGGRGRHDREWKSPAGGVWCSLVVRPEVAAERTPLLTFAGAVAVVETARAIGIPAVIKWPNDVLVGPSGETAGRKLAGVLTEGGQTQRGQRWAVVGVGVNAAVDRAAIPDSATSLQAETAEPVDRSTVAARLIDRFVALAGDSAAILSAWRAHAATLGQRVRVRTAQETFDGEARRVTDTGALVVWTGTRERVVTAADCEHLRPAESG